MKALTEGPLLWYLDRSSGLLTMLLLTLSTVLGVLSTRGRAGRRVPAFVTQNLHRNISLLAVSLLVLHLVTSVAHEFVDIRWWNVFVPFGSPYEPLLVGMGAVAVDLILLVVITSLLRDRLQHGHWRLIHATSYLAWAVGSVHGFFLGTDTAHRPWSTVTLACVGVVAISALFRLVVLAKPELERVR
ncbi:MAG: ferric reductase [Nocardioides sp.]|jgi:sulfoxide reductase heme-binding subunit YedZ